MAGSASGQAVARTMWLPGRMASPRTAMRLFASASRVALRIRTVLTKRLATWTKRAAGRAWSPLGSMTMSWISAISGPQELGHRRGSRGSRRDLLDRCPNTGLDRGEDCPLDEGRLADPDPSTLALGQLLEGKLEAECGTAQVEQDDDTGRALRPGRDGAAERRGDPGRARAQAPILSPTRDLDTNVGAGDLDDHLAQAFDEHRAVRNQDQVDQLHLRL